MRVLLTGHQGYIGPIAVSALQEAGHDVVGLDTGLFVRCALEELPAVPAIQRDVRDVSVDDLRGFDAVVHLAGLSNDPLGSLDPALTHEINLAGTVRLARAAREASVPRFAFASSCSVYGAAVEPWVDETTALHPVTAYGETKAAAERALVELGDDTFCTISLRNATAFGYSPNLRTDILVNDLVSGAFLRGEIRLNSDGSAWRPFVHVRDIAQAFVRAIEAPAEVVNRQAFNVGSDEQNYTVMEVAKAVAELVPGARLTVAEGAGADKRSYRVRFEKIGRLLPGFACRYDVRAGVREIEAELRRISLQSADGGIRLAHLRQLIAAGELDEALRFRQAAAVAA